MKKKRKKKVATKKNRPTKKPKPAPTDQDESASFQRRLPPRDTSKGHLGARVQATRAQKHQSR